MLIHLLFHSALSIQRLALFPLAESNAVGWTGIIVGVFSMLLGTATAFVLARVQRNQSLQDAARIADATRVERLEAALKAADASQHALVEKLIDERMRAITHELRAHVQGLVTTIDDIKGRLEDGDGQILALAASDHAIELKIAAKFDMIKDWMRDSFAGKRDLENHENSMTRKVSEIDRDVRAVQTAVAVLDKAVTLTGGKTKP